MIFPVGPGGMRGFLDDPADDCLFSDKVTTTKLVLRAG